MESLDEFLDNLYDEWYALYFDRVLLSVAFVIGTVLVPVEVGQKLFAPLLPLFWIMGFPVWAVIS